MCCTVQSKFTKKSNEWTAYREWDKLQLEECSFGGYLSYTVLVLVGEYDNPLRYEYHTRDVGQFIKVTIPCDGLEPEEQYKRKNFDAINNKEVMVRGENISSNGDCVQWNPAYVAGDKEHKPPFDLSVGALSDQKWGKDLVSCKRTDDITNKILDLFPNLKNRINELVADERKNGWSEPPSPGFPNGKPNNSKPKLNGYIYAKAGFYKYLISNMYETPMKVDHQCCGDQPEDSSPYNATINTMEETRKVFNQWKGAE